MQQNQRDDDRPQPPFRSSSLGTTAPVTEGNDASSPSRRMACSFSVLVEGATRGWAALIELLCPSLDASTWNPRSIFAHRLLCVFVPSVSFALYSSVCFLSQDSELVLLPALFLIICLHVVTYSLLRHAKLPLGVQVYHWLCSLLLLLLVMGATNDSVFIFAAPTMHLLNTTMVALLNLHHWSHLAASLVLPNVAFVVAAVVRETGNSELFSVVVCSHVVVGGISVVAIYHMIQCDASHIRSMNEESSEKKRVCNELFELTFDAIAIHCEGIIVDANRQFATLFGYPISVLYEPEPVVRGAPITNFVYGRFIRTAGSNWRMVQSTDSSRVGEVLRRHDGSTVLTRLPSVSVTGKRANGQEFSCEVVENYCVYDGKPSALLVIREKASQQDSSGVDHHSLTPNPTNGVAEPVALDGVVASLTQPA